MGTDNAGGGQRGLRATSSDALLAAVCRAYGVGDGLDPVDLGGSSNLNLLVGDDDDRFVVRVYRPHVTAARLRAIQTVRRTLAGAGVPCAPLVPTRDGRSWIAVADRLVEVERFVACMQFFEDPTSDEQLRRIGRLLEAYDAGSMSPLSGTERAALPLALARQPLWSIGGWVTALDDETAARRHAADMVAPVRWARRLLDEVGRWQAAMAGRS